MNKKAKIKVISVIIALLFVSFSLFIFADSPSYTIDGDSVYIDDSKVMINVTPHTSNEPVVHFKSKVYSGDVDIVLGFDTEQITPISASTNPHYTDVEKSYKCDYEFNYTTSPKYAWCYYNNNVTDVIIFEHSFDYGYLDEKTIYWSESELVWNDVSGAFNSANIQFQNYDKWYYKQGININAGQDYYLKLNLRPNSIKSQSYKYFFGIKPSSETLSEAIAKGHFYYIDPWTEALNQSLYIYYKLDDNYLDATGNNSASGYGGVSFVNALLNNGSKIVYETNGSIYSDANTGITGANSWSMSAWVNIASQHPIQPNGLLTLGTYGTSSKIISLQVKEVGSPNVLKLISWGGACESETIPSGVVLVGNWHHFVVTYNGSICRLYVDGNNIFNATGTLNLADDEFKIGFSGSSAQNSNATYDEVALWKRELTIAEVRSLNNSGTPLPLNEGESNTAPTIFSNTTSPTTLYNLTDYLVNLTITDPDADNLTGYVEFFVNNVSKGVYSNTATNNTNTLIGTLEHSNFTKNNDVVASVWAGDGTENTTAVNLTTKLVQNSIPTDPTDLTINATVQVNQVLHGVCSDSTDADNDAITYHYEFYNTNDTSTLQAFSTTQTYQIQLTDAHDLISVRCKATTSDANSTNYDEENITVSNSAPVITTLQTTVSQDTDGTYIYDYNVSDTDNDTIVWYDNTTLFDINSSTGEISDTPTTDEVGTYQILITASDGITNTTDEFIYTINDITPPNVTINTPTNTTSSNNTIVFNVTSTDETAMDTCVFSLDSASNVTMTNSGDNWNYTNSSMTDGSHIVQFFCNDTSNNVNSSQSITFTIDTTPPVINVWYPINNTNYTTNTIYFNASNDTVVSSWIVNYNGTNVTININSSLTVEDGSFDLTIYANDSVGNWGSNSSIKFLVDTTSPNITLLAPDNNGEDADGIVDFYYNVSDFRTVSNCSIYLDSLLTQTTSSITRNTTLFFTTTNTKASDTLNWYITCTDDLGNSANSSTWILDTLEGSSSGGNSGGGGGSSWSTLTLETLGIDNVDTLLCELTYGNALNYSTNNINIIQDEYQWSSGKSVQWTEVRDYIQNWQTICSDEVGLTLEPEFVCQKLFFFVIENNNQILESELKELKNEIDKSLPISTDLLKIYLRNNEELCVKNGYSDRLPFRTLSISTSLFNFTECSPTTGVQLFDLGLNFLRLDIGKDVSCGKVEFLRLFLSVEKNESGVFQIRGLKLWYFIFGLLCFGIWWWFKRR